VPRDLTEHDCIVLGATGSPVRWPFPGKAKGEVTLVAIDGKLTFSSFAMAKTATLAGLGIAIFPEFACAEELREKLLVAVLDSERVEVGSVWLLHAAGRFLPARTRAFVTLARERFTTERPWLPKRRSGQKR
jgi:DNA-binding transcriptional LysR family regulator